ncbi:hypothetical protein MesoLjLc_50600 [Mesorhizobium sp. L-8-10]|uniref:hypothetical protein n=1 Tax=Mesorhizobium sp. L-8-10 TaxID=2744523 RepID=UPI0019275007|nr:hypothetical protein [Mesorhizobium sp. L-8-10]BCH33130.1 hypothetical protein MesoLjLc_50600 [Mesorhizobium sp. L-8-10]
MRARMHDGGAFSRSVFQAINKTATAGGSGDATEVNGDWVDRELASVGRALSAKLVIAFTAALGQDETLTFAMNFQDATSLAGAGAADFSDAVTATTVATGDSGGSTETGTFEVDIDLSGAKQFIRTQVTPNLSASGTDTCEWSAILMFYGDHRQPSTQAVAKLGDADGI